jgi:hypothetical protein
MDDMSLQEIAQSTGTTPNEAMITSSNLPFIFLCGHVKKKKEDNMKSRYKMIYYDYEVGQTYVEVEMEFKFGGHTL